jgi:hypothetical protein
MVRARPAPIPTLAPKAEDFLISLVCIESPKACELLGGCDLLARRKRGCGAPNSEIGNRNVGGFANLA